MQLNRPKQRESIQKLSQLKGISLICTAHTGYTNNFGGAMQDWIAVQP